MEPIQLAHELVMGYKRTKRVKVYYRIFSPEPLEREKNGTTIKD
jgi:hypothetical protein